MKPGNRIIPICLSICIGFVLLGIGSLIPGNLSDMVKEAPAIFLFFGVLLSYILAYLGRTEAWWPGGVIGGVLGYIFSGFGGILIFGFAGLILDYILSRNYKQWKMEHKTTAWRRTWGGFYNGKSPFKFGGGLSGGGGATGKW